MILLIPIFVATLTFIVKEIVCTIDVNLAELKYLSIRLESDECRLLVASLRYSSYDLPLDLKKIARNLDANIPCLKHLLYWNGANDGKTHELLQRRLRQLGRSDLADWLGKTIFKELGKDLLDIVNEPFGEIARTEFNDIIVKNDNTINYDKDDSSKKIKTTTKAKEMWNYDDDYDDYGDAELWIDLITVALFATLIFLIVILIGLLIIHKIARCK